LDEAGHALQPSRTGPAPVGPFGPEPPARGPEPAGRTRPGVGTFGRTVRRARGETVAR
jgi:hypothetical protein